MGNDKLSIDLARSQLLLATAPNTPASSFPLLQFEFGMPRKIDGSTDRGDTDGEIKGTSPSAVVKASGAKEKESSVPESGKIAPSAEICEQQYDIASS
mmetsp:Transcript_26466/g.49199  ORF Transcript_26466/g.49199 Transcript_26466/m.49199 type:complete len:98 (+) Transcript_26466:289-582(+)